MACQSLPPVVQCRIRRMSRAPSPCHRRVGSIRMSASTQPSNLLETFCRRLASQFGRSGTEFTPVGVAAGPWLEIQTAHTPSPLARCAGAIGSTRKLTNAGSPPGDHTDLRTHTSSSRHSGPTWRSATRQPARLRCELLADARCVSGLKAGEAQFDQGREPIEFLCWAMNRVAVRFIQWIWSPIIHVWLTLALSRGAPASVSRRRLQRLVGPPRRSQPTYRPLPYALRRERHQGAVSAASSPSSAATIAATSLPCSRAISARCFRTSSTMGSRRVMASAPSAPRAYRSRGARTQLPEPPPRSSHARRRSQDAGRFQVNR